MRKDPYFFIDIKDQVFNVAAEFGKVDKVFIEQDSPGHVYVKFEGSSYDKAVESASKTVEGLAGKTFDERVISVRFVPEREFNQKIINR